jgi:hypothetical protein
MPLDRPIRERVDAYCRKHLEDHAEVGVYFAFVTEERLRQALVREFLAARFISKLQEGLHFEGEELRSSAKFQIIQYASIYEAVINHVLFERLNDTTEVDGLRHHVALKKVSGLSSSTAIAYEGSPAFLAIEDRKKTELSSIKYSDKMECALQLGLVTETQRDVILETYRLRNSVHIEASLKSVIDYELDHARKAYLRLKPTMRKIGDRLSDFESSEA